ncbi:ECF subfamily RNA polymerase sigma-24 factor [Novosphingobium nitrogenifigens DSM 19370]|uniref:ECF subfamily RNA polymerase sigma-24 factor n=1 Tax=Novosphingobium nitrogenifigens DSM 19370 TaxID=983920 RepID=F1ZAI3_9SPHN|nr:sigma-70 family RNA polymerase sigma factor [Novosphingobium nitrogenifigens]EGD58408.1 ECF subfamily RNA polymerase sigma-24 factor [Novosphingobium nitrogenifigens DSM 19370]
MNPARCEEWMEDARSALNGLQALFAGNRPVLLRFLTARCGDAGMAEDLLHELWLKLERIAPGPVANGQAYLFRMANNLVLDHARARQRAMRRDRDWIDADGSASLDPEDRLDPADSAEEILLRRQEADRLHEAIAALPEGARRALWLYRIEEKGQGEIAAILGISRSGVEKHLALAMKRLRAHLCACGLLGPTSSGDRAGGEAKR